MEALCALVVDDDSLPLLSLLQVEPLQMQSSHLTFQEYFCACALRRGTPLPPTALPWTWTAWWANVLRFGRDMGGAFGAGPSGGGHAALRRARGTPRWSLVFD